MKRRVSLAMVSLIILSFFAPAALGAGAPPAEVTKAAEPGSPLETILFCAVAGLTVVCALGVCVSKNIVRMAVWLFGALGSVAILYFMLAANFIAAIQLIVYVGGTLILLVFGVMLTSKLPWARFETRRSELVAAAIVCVVLAVALIGTLLGTQWPQAQPADPQPVAVLGTELLTTYLVPFEVASVLLLVVMIGAAYLVYLGLCLLLERGTSHDFGNNHSAKLGLWTTYRRGILTNVLNPKVAIFFLSRSCSSVSFLSFSVLSEA